VGFFVVSEVFRSNECREAEDEKGMEPDKEDKFVSGFSLMELLFELGLLFALLNYLGLAVMHLENG
jgi:hypothetical protein